jgi:adenosylcobinamide-GDP ribazoletransferase
MIAGLRLSLSWLTVLPVRGPEVNRTAAARAIAAGPLVGLLLGGGACGLAWLLRAAGLPALLIGLLTVAALLLATRGMHIDGLADTMDGLGCYGPPARAREVMRGGGVGPFGVAAVVVAIGVQSAAFGALTATGRPLALILAVAAGRVAVVAACGHGTVASEGAGFGALVADTQPRTTRLAWAAALLAASVVAVPSHVPWSPAAAGALLAPAAALALTRHCARRFEGLSGDVLGAAVEVATTVYAVFACFGAQLAG